LGGNWKIEEERAISRYGDLKQEVSLESGKTYEVSFRVLYWRSGGAYLQPFLGGVAGEKITSAIDGEVITQKITVGEILQGSPEYLPSELILSIPYGRRAYLNVEIDDVSVREVSGEEDPDIIINPNITCYKDSDCEESEERESVLLRKLLEIQLILQ